MREYASRSPEGYGGPLWTEGDLAYLRENYGTMSGKDIAAHLGRSYQAVMMRANKLGLKSRHRVGVNSLVKDYFKVIDTPMKAWVLGLLASDGSVSKAGQLEARTAPQGSWRSWKRSGMSLPRMRRIHLLLAPGRRPWCGFMVAGSRPARRSRKPRGGERQDPDHRMAGRSARRLREQLRLRLLRRGRQPRDEPGAAVDCRLRQYRVP